MNVHICCEESQSEMKAFLNAGHNAYSWAKQWTEKNIKNHNETP